MGKKVLVPIADGSEEIEAVTIIDVLRRAGADVTVAGVRNLQITASRGVKLEADKLITECMGKSWDLIALPGGMPGAENLRDSKDLESLLLSQAENNCWIAAICAAPAVILAPLGLLSDRRATCHPSFIERLDNATASRDRVVIDGYCVTSQGPGSALELSLALVRILFGTEKVKEVAAPMVPHKMLLESILNDNHLALQP